MVCRQRHIISIPSAPQPPQPPHTRFRQVCVAVFFFWCDLGRTLARGPVAERNSGGAAKRRRDRRLRMHWRHKQLTLQMALAAALHHSRDVGPVTYIALRSQKTARAEATNNALRSQKSSVAGDTELFSFYEEELGGTRPDRLYEVRPQERDQRHTVEQIVDTVLFVPSLDVPVPQMENQLVDVCRLFDILIPEQAIEVPKISPTPRPPRRRRVRFAEQTAEQLVEVPTIISYSSLLQRTVEQNVNIPISGRGGQNVNLQDFPPRQSSTAQHASQERSSERIVERIVDSRVLGGGLQDFRPGQGPAASSSSFSWTRW